ncbi:hypothetical protein ACFSVM_00405 [Paenibacillus shunpengii]|uniref:Uncharacterized protein n=1 Tax=Paenibacillus shunpengii TaxID=2054424 RepID=A0ABW5SGT5_9BACL
MVNYSKKVISTVLSTALVLSILVTGSTWIAQGSSPTKSDANQVELAKSAGDKKVEVIKA